jgi:hypothetical protein
MPAGVLVAVPLVIVFLVSEAPVAANVSEEIPEAEGFLVLGVPEPEKARVPLEAAVSFLAAIPPAPTNGT